MKIIITGIAGFIGGNTANYLHNLGHEVIGIDNFSNYYSPKMKRMHVSAELNLEIIEGDVVDRKFVFQQFKSIQPDYVIHLAAQGGVRASRKDPFPYLSANQIGFLNVLQASETHHAIKFIYASSSSVYGEGLPRPFRENSILPAPKSLYALSKLSNENIASNLPYLGTQRIGLRFFTVYGPWGRPDMAVFRLLASKILGESFKLTANLNVIRDFTYVSDVTETINSIINSNLDFKKEIFNVAGSHPNTIAELLELLDKLNAKPDIEILERDSMDVEVTHGSIEKLTKFGITTPSTPLKIGVEHTWNWIQKFSANDLREWFDYFKI
jgi:UDP-glucuronate 4-epimerase